MWTCPSVASRWNGASFRSDQRLHRPAILPVGGDEPPDLLLPVPVSGLDLDELVPLLALQPPGGPPQGGDGPRQRGRPGGPDRRILAPQEFLGLGRPRHQLAVQAGPTRLEPAPEVGGGQGLPHPVQEPPLQVRVVEEPTAGPGVDDAEFARRDAEPLPGRRLVPAGDHDGP